jgi:two-component system, LytTR family, sensor kinase
MSKGLGKSIRRFCAYFAAWTVFGLFFFTEDMTRKVFSGEKTPWWHYLVSWLTGTFVLASFTPAILALGRHFEIQRRNWRSRFALHLVFSISFAFADLAIEGALLAQFHVFPEFIKSSVGGIIFLLVIAFHSTVFTYWLLLGIQYTWHSYKLREQREKDALRLELRASELQSQLAHAQLGALKSQLQPHFLFNTLNAIMVLVRQRRPAEAEQTISLLSDLLRLVLNDVDAQEVSLERELEYLKLYLAIEQIRFQDRMVVDIAAEPVTLNTSVPHMGLQPIVENAIRHGIGRVSQSGNISIRSRLLSDQVWITVQDDGPGLPEGFSQQNFGIGLANTQARLSQLYGGKAKIMLDSQGIGGTVATLILPYRPITNPAVSSRNYELENVNH